MTTTELLSHLRGLGVSIWAEGERLRINAPAGVLTAAVRQQVSERKAEILSFLARASRSATPAPVIPPWTRVSRDGALPPSFAQQRLWFLEQLQPGSPTYNIPVAFRLQGLHPGILTAVLTEILRRHEVLRTTFPVADGEPVQKIAPPAPAHLPIVDLGGLPAGVREREEGRLLLAEARRPFDLSRGPLFRAALLRSSEEVGVGLLNMHHTVSDGWSLEILLREIALLYGAFGDGRPSPLPALPFQYADFAAWQRTWLQGEILDAELAYWRKRLQGAPPVLTLPTDRPRPPAQTFQGATRRFRPPEKLAALLPAVARQRNATPFMLLVAAFQVLLCRYSGQEDISVGTPVAGRHRVETEPLIGLFVNTLVIRADLSGDPRLLDLLAQVQSVTLEAYQHQDLPFEKLVEELRPERNLSHSPLFQVMIALQSFTGTASSGLGIRRLGVGTGMAKFDLSLMLAEVPGGVAGGFEHNTDLFDGATVQRMAEHFTVLLHEIVTQPERRISTLPLLSPAERQQLLREWNDTGAPQPGPLLHTLFEEQAGRTPDAIAVICAGRRSTYRELNERADVLAAHLWARGVKLEEVVGVCLDRSEEMIAALLGILKAGAAYLPLDPGYPRERLSSMIGDAGARIVLTREPLSEGLPAGPGVEILALPSSRRGERNPRHRPQPENLAYLIYTSGSTGRPKGVAISHGSVVELIRWSREVFADREIAATLASTSINFDVSVFELFVPLCRGGTVLLIDNAVALIERRGEIAPSLLSTVPSAMAELLRADAVPPSVETVNLAGEPVQAALIHQIHERSAARRVYDLYGPTEDTVYSTYGRLDRDLAGEPPIGRPISGTRVRLLDGDGRPVPIGVPGELCLGGGGLARGYLGQPALTAGRFVPDPLAGEPGGRLYRTGDRARHRPDGQIEFLGRLDAQVKIRGFRIEPAEIEVALTRHPEIRSAVVIPRSAAAGQELSAVLVPAGTSRPSAGELRQFLGEILPAHMIPASFTFAGELPRTASGKIDRRNAAALADGPSVREKPYVPPVGDTERTLVEIWQRVLGREGIGVEDNFFDLGGDSLKSIRVLTLLRERGFEGSVHGFFRHQTVRAFARFCAEAGGVKAEDLDFEPPVHLIGPGGEAGGLAGAEATLAAHPALDEVYLVPGRYRGGIILYCFYRLRPGARLTERELARLCRARLPAEALPSRFLKLSPAATAGEVSRARLARFLDFDIDDVYELGPTQDWFFVQPWRRPFSFVMPRGRWIEGTVDPAVLEETCRALIEHHAILNTVFPDVRLARYQVVVRPPKDEPLLELHDLSGMAVEEQRERMEREIQRAVDGLSLNRWPLFRFFLFQVAADHFYFHFICHHLLCDEVSIGILTEDLFRLYRGLATEGRRPDLPPAKNLYAEYVRWLRRFQEDGGMEESARFWRREVPPELTLPRMPIDFPDARDSAALRDQKIIELTPDETQRLERSSRELFQSSLYSVLVVAAGRAVARWSAQDDIVLLDIRHGRIVSDQIDLERAIGFFALGRPVRIVDARRSDLSELVQTTVGRMDLVTPEMGCHYGCLWQELPNHFNTVPTADKMIVNHLGSRSATRPGAGFQPSLHNDEILPCLVEFVSTVVDGGLRVTALYSRARLRSATVERLAVLLREELEALLALA